MRHRLIEIPYNLEPSELVPDPATSKNDDWRDELDWFAQYAQSEEEVERILRAAVVLKAADNNLPVGQCLHTAIIWERG
jgi:hypothetical protein